MVFPGALAYMGTAVAFSSVAAVFDLSQRRIPNWLTVPGIVVGVLLHLAIGGFAQAGWSFLAGCIGGAFFLFFYLAGGMCAGDVRLITAIGCMLGITSIREVLLVTVFFGAALAVGMAALRGRLLETFRNVLIVIGHHAENGLSAHPELNVDSKQLLRLPYALPVAMGCLMMFVMASIGEGIQ